KHKQEARLNSDTKSSNFFITVLNKAFPSDGRVFPKKRIVIPLGLIVGFMTGCSLGFVKEYFENTFKRPSDVEVYAQIPVLFSIPFKEDLQRMEES
ncbi:MAG: hypothetical protein HQK89_04345, partial [Nitrospirae bacterium]|nr:hypothetical protein [Nitrospirota bacterium]